jgi:multicomponent Na+:H+ antiporter subunit A
LFKGTLFLCAGSVQHAAGTRDMRELGGLASRMSRTALAWIIAGAAIIGVPLTNGFVSKWLLFDAALNGGQWAVATVAWLVSVVTAFYILKATVSVFFGEAPKTLQDKPAHESPFYMQAGMLSLAGLCLVFGIAPQILDRWVVVPAVQGLGFAVSPSLTWLGIHALSNSLSPAFAAVIVLLSLLVGLVFVEISKAGQASSAAVFTGGELLPADNAVGVEDFAAIAETSLQPVYRTTDPDPLYLRVWDGIRNTAGWSEGLVKPLEGHPLLAYLVLGLFLTALVWLWK